MRRPVGVPIGLRFMSRGIPRVGGDRDRRCRAALLPGATELDLLARYETHAERSLYRAIETLAKLRGVRVAVVAARVRMGQATGNGDR